jgi:hypothetical protein
MLDVGVLEPFGDPPLDVTESVSEVSACLESRRALASVSPRVQGGHRHVQVAGELPDGQEPVELIHDGTEEQRYTRLFDSSNAIPQLAGRSATVSG